MNRINTILTYWFGEGPSADLPTEAHTHRWFGCDDVIDKEIASQFEVDVHAAAAHEYDDWCHTARGSLALILLLDQFPRNIYRNTPRSFAYDEMALRVCLKGLDVDRDQQLSLIERVFFYLPLEHAEDKEIQQSAVSAFRSLLDLTFTETRNVYQTFYDYAVEHQRVIEKFGRFPHRNAILGRQSTAEEIQYLQQLQQV